MLENSDKSLDVKYYDFEKKKFTSACSAVLAWKKKAKNLKEYKNYKKKWDFEKKIGDSFWASRSCFSNF